MTPPSQRSVALFTSGLNCAESVLQAIAEYKGVKSNVIPKVATAFCAGVARTGGMCGALAGAIMGLSLVHGRNKPGDPYEECFDLTGRIIELFEKRFGATNCPDLIGCHLGTKEGQEKFKAEDLRENKCRLYTEEATDMAVMLLDRWGDKNNGHR